MTGDQETIMNDVSGTVDLLALRELMLRKVAHERNAISRGRGPKHQRAFFGIYSLSD